MADKVAAAEQNMDEAAEWVSSSSAAEPAGEHGLADTSRCPLERWRHDRDADPRDGRRPGRWRRWRRWRRGRRGRRGRRVRRCDNSSVGSVGHRIRGRRAAASATSASTSAASASASRSASAAVGAGDAGDAAATQRRALGSQHESGWLQPTCDRRIPLLRVRISSGITTRLATARSTRETGPRRGPAHPHGAGPDDDAERREHCPSVSHGEVYRMFHRVGRDMHIIISFTHMYDHDSRKGHERSRCPQGRPGRP